MIRLSMTKPQLTFIQLSKKLLDKFLFTFYLYNNWGDIPKYCSRGPSISCGDIQPTGLDCSNLRPSDIMLLRSINSGDY